MVDTSGCSYVMVSAEQRCVVMSHVGYVCGCRILSLVQC